MYTAVLTFAANPVLRPSSKGSAPRTCSRLTSGGGVGGGGRYAEQAALQALGGAAAACGEVNKMYSDIMYEVRPGNACAETVLVVSASLTDCMSMCSRHAVQWCKYDGASKVG